MTTFRVLLLTAVLLAGLPVGAGAWQTTLSGRAGSLDLLGAMAPDPTGGVVVAGTTLNAGTGFDLTVVKIAADGGERWRRTFSGAFVDAWNVARAVVVTPAGDVIVGGDLGTERGVDFVVLRLAATDGAEQWRFTEPGRGWAVAVDPAGDVVAAGQLDSSGTRVFGVVKLAGASGRELWRSTRRTEVVSASVAIGRDGNVVVAVGSGLSSWVMVLPSGTGAPALTQEYPGRIAAIAVDPQGAVVGVGTAFGAPGTASDILVLKWDPSDGSGWLKRIDGPDHASDEGLGVAVAQWGIGVVGRFGTAAPPWGGNDAVILGMTPWGEVGWQQTFRGTRPERTNVGFALAAMPGSSPDPVVVGTLTNHGGGVPFVARLAWATGGEVWRQTIDGGTYDDFRWVTVAADGSVVVAGTLGGDDQHIGVVNLAVESGTERWRRTVQGTGSNSLDGVGAVATDAAGDVVAAGYTDAIGDKGAMTIAKFSGATGAELWRRSYDAMAAGEWPSLWRAVVTDAAGDVFAVGWRTVDDIESRSMVAVKLSGTTGAELWMREIAGAGSGRSFAGAHAVAVHPSGDVLVAGEIQNDATGIDFAVFRLSGATGEERWHAFARGTQRDEFSNNVARRLQVDPSGNVVAAGELDGQDSDRDLAVVKFSGETGAERWRRVFDDLPGSEWPTALAVDAAGDVAVAGLVPVSLRDERDVLVAKLAGGDGTDRWRRDLGPASDASADGGLPSIVLDGQGHVVVGASLLHGTGEGHPIPEFAVMKLDAATGAELWRPSTGPGFIGMTYALGLDPGGDVLAAGYMSFGDTGGSVVLKFAGASGQELWRKHLGDGSDWTLGDVWMTALAVDGGGNVVLGGLTHTPGMSQDWAVLKRSGATGDDAFCGDGVPAVGEECDDGNVRGGDGCSAVCALAVDTPLDACAGDRVPKRITRGFQKARRTLHAAEGTPQGHRRKRLLARTTARLGQVRQAIHRAAHRRHRRLSGPCAEALLAVAGEMTARVAALRAGSRA